MEIVHTDKPLETAVKALTDALQQDAGVPILLLVSGGSAFGLLDLVPDSVLGPQLTLAVLDERCSEDPHINNFAQLQVTDFYQRAVAAEVVVLPTLVKEGESCAIVGQRFEAMLRAWRETHPTGVVVATMGIGPDGHTAGIMPGEYEGVDFAGQDWVVSYEVPESVNPYTQRITVTNTFLETQVDQAIVYAVGAEKRQYIEYLTAGEHSDLPFGVLYRMRSVIVFS
jgi:6-phosphogluconolactonase/glucosamine-6-phosphate isomerase/deaminase